ncbi:hypothetical protein J2795_001263 [Chryseobacterium bernardetii]|uniref:Uncharacterized protein n=3 Tax=Chryseobacterium TaxID=59732 RepID=A0A543EJN1_9FLAO|nr:hypothetical protein [Chryseobacterium vietnamense]MDR6440563.1 hypothetical protein [Chryseobacterium bernardetii]MDR6458261.1 hypothetical protein [Chryseobacterium vietnamense]MDR6486870.1 hypothetical protein [Chryseobacterium vietnamense]TQM21808.1 hypothetical protein FB551_1507 [Chryseobacterium aquifrigidense]
MKIRDFLWGYLGKIKSKFVVRIDKNEFRGYKKRYSGMFG